jgi:teichuronic acid exporter
MMNQGKSVFKSLFWKFLERMATQLVIFIVTLVLARLLGPEDYGTTALISIFVTFATVIVQDGFNTALIRKKEIDEDDYTTSLYFSLFLAVILYIVIYFIAPLVANFYNISSLTGMLRVLGLVIFPAAFNSIQVAYLTKKMEFKKMFIGNFLASCCSGFISILFAINYHSAWAIILNQLLYQFLSCTFLHFVGGWYPNGKYSYDKLKDILGFGSKMLFISLLVNLFMNIRILLIGKYYNSEQLGYFSRGKSFSSTLMEGINGSIQTVILPTYSNIQDSLSEIKKYVRRTIGLSCYILFPMLIGLACVARPLVLTLLGTRWESSIPFVQIFAMAYLFQPTQIATAQALKALKKGNTIVIIEIFRKSFEFGLLILTLKMGTYKIALSALFAGILSILVTVFPNKRILKYQYSEQLMDFLIPLINSLLMGTIILVLNKFLPLSNILSLIIDVVLGVICYMGISIISKNEYYYFLKDKIMNFFQRKLYEKVS